MFTLTIDTNGAAFDGSVHDAGNELARILSRQLDKLREGHVRGDCFDVNGNHVGEWSFGERRVVAVDRNESDACERNTDGCCIDHTQSAASVSCDTW